MKQKKREGLKRIIIRISALLLAAAVLGGNKIIVQASSQYDVLGLLLGLDDEGDAVFVVSAFALIEESEQVLFSGTFTEEAEEIIFVTNTGNTFDLSGVEMVEGEDFFIFPMDGADREQMLSDPAFLNWTNPIQNESANVVYWVIDEDEELSINSEKVRVKDVQQDYLLEVEGLPKDLGIYPAPILNNDGQLIGMVTKKDKVFTLFDVDQEVFYGGSSDAAPDSNDGGDAAPDSDDGGDAAPDSNDREGVPSDSDGSSDSEKSSGSDGDSKNYGGSGDDRTENFYQKWGKQIGTILACTVLSAVCISLFMRASKKKKEDSMKQAPPSAPYTPYTPCEHSSGIEEIEETQPIDDIGVTLPVEEAEPVSVQTAELCLQARGGCMDGRIYVVGKDGIRIGRDISNEIQYPRETRGVSRTHCKLYWDGGRLMLMDCSSTSGTFLKGIGSLQPMKPVEVKTGDIFYVGEKNNSFQIEKVQNIS